MTLSPSIRLFCFSLAAFLPAFSQGSEIPIPVAPFEQQSHQGYTTTDGLPSNEVQRVYLTADYFVVAETIDGAVIYEDGKWHAIDSKAPAETLSPQQAQRLQRAAGNDVEVRTVATHESETAVATNRGLFIEQDDAFTLAMPEEDVRRWAPVDVRATTYDAAGRLWFAAPQGVGYREDDGSWRLFTGAEGLPFNDFTTMTAWEDEVWFGTTNGAIRYRDGEWTFRQGRRWLLDNHVRDIVVDRIGHVWIATSAGLSRIMRHYTTLQEKAEFIEAEIARYHLRTEYGFVCPADLDAPGDKQSGKAVFTDNDGHFNGLYLAAVSWGYAATGREKLKEDAHRAFRALRFLGEVTEGGTHPAPEGFIARAVLPTSEPDPNPQFDLAYDQKRNERDALWKIIQPRWPVSESGDYYWKNDSSSDELDGHFFGYAVYYDHVCETEEEKEAVRAVVRRITDHLIRHGYNLVDYDGQPTRWGRFSPEDMNANPQWVDERGLKSYSMLNYLSIAHHMTGDAKYREHYEKLAFDHGFGMNGMTQPKTLPGPFSHGHQPDDNMAFLNYYHLIRYETDPKLLSMYYQAIYMHWQYERYERNAFANFIYAASCYGKVREDHWGPTELMPTTEGIHDAIDTLKRYPTDLINWPMSNAHRIDLLRHRDAQGNETGNGGNHKGYAYPIDERHEIYWDLNPWLLDYNGDGKKLRDGFPYLLAYYMGLAHGFIAVEKVTP